MVSRTLIIGASGQVGRHVVSLLHQHCPVVAMVRDKTRTSALFPSGVDVIEADIETDISDALHGCSRVVFSAGSGAGTSAEQTLLVDLWAACKVIDRAKSCGVTHFLMVSSRGADNPDNGPLPIKPYLIAKHVADRYLIDSGLPYTILRPGRLIDERATGLVNTVRPVDPKQQVISREDTAASIVHCLCQPVELDSIYELYQGCTPIAQALV